MLDGLLPGFLVCQVIETVVTVTVVTKLAVSETIAVEFETLGLGAVAGLSWSDTLHRETFYLL